MLRYSLNVCRMARFHGLEPQRVPAAGVRPAAPSVTAGPNPTARAGGEALCAVLLSQPGGSASIFFSTVFCFPVLPKQGSASDLPARTSRRGGGCRELTVLPEPARADNPLCAPREPPGIRVAAREPCGSKLLLALLDSTAACA